MTTSRFPAQWLLACLLLGAGCIFGSARADDDDLKRRAVALNDITGEDPIKGEIKALVKDAAGTRKLLALAGSLAKDKEQPFSYNGAYILARTAQELKEYETSKTFYLLCIEQSGKLLSGKKIAQSYTGLIDLLTAQKKYEECIRVCQEFLELPEEGQLMTPVRNLKSAVLRRLIQSLAKAGQADKANKLVDTLVGAQEDNIGALDLRGWVQREAGRYDDAVKTFLKLMTLIEKDEKLTKDEKAELTADYRYLLSSVYIDLKKVDKAAEMLKLLLAEKPNDPTYNNDLGYIWADHDLNLPEAERLIRKALDEDKKRRKPTGDKPNSDLDPEDDNDNAAYLDSLGWVLFKQKKYEEAKKYLLQAVQEKEGQHIEILDHLADVHMALGEKDQAVAIWKKAIQLEPSGRREEERKVEVEKKLKKQ